MADDETEIGDLLDVIGHEATNQPHYRNPPRKPTSSGVG